MMIIPIIMIIIIIVVVVWKEGMKIYVAINSVVI